MPTYPAPAVEIVGGRGAQLHDRAGRTYIDLVAGIAVASVGHCHPAVVAAISEQAAQLIHVSNLYSTSPHQRLAARLASLTGGKLAFFCNSGAEAVECALKLARKWGRQQRGPQATRIVAAAGGFHGRTFGALAATGQRAKRVPFEPMLPGFTHVPFGDITALEAALTDDVAAVLLESIQGEAGVVVPPPGYLRAVRALCDEHAVLLMLDEVQSGLGRTGAWFGYEHDGIEPDVVCLAKALAAGLPIGACLAGAEIAAVFQPGDHASTFGGGPVQSAAALAVLDVIEEEKLIPRAAVAGERLMAGLRRCFGAGAVVRGRGLLIAVELAAPIAGEIVMRALGKGVLLNSTSASVLRITPPLVIGDGEIDRALAALQEVLDET